MNFTALAISILVFGPAALGQPKGRIDHLIAKYPSLAKGHLGYQVVDLASGKVLAQRDQGRFFIPASNTKLYTTALALVRLGPNYKFRTEVRSSGPGRNSANSVAELQLVGGGDPNLSGRLLPYAADSPDGDSLGVLKDLADTVTASGIHSVDGDVVGVAARYPGDPYPDGWTVDDSLYGYGAPVSSLSVNDSIVSLTVRGTTLGELADIGVKPGFLHFILLNQVITDASQATDIHVFRPSGSNEVVLSGSIGKLAPDWKEDIGVDDPALFAAEAFTDVLRDRGISVLGDPAESVDAGSGPLLASHESGPLWQAVQVVNKVSQNLHAEMLLREVGFSKQGVGTLKAGLAERDAFLNGLGITANEPGVFLEDGSGLARQDLTTPASTIKLLRYMWDRPEHEMWLQSLPVGGLDGSLQHRFQKMRGAARVHAKTGSIAHVATLSGYIETAQHRWLAFSFMVNSTVAHDGEVSEFLDRFCGLF